MTKPSPRRASLRAAALVAVSAAIVTAAAPQPASVPDDALVAAFKQTYPASVSDAVELVTGRNYVLSAASLESGSGAKPATDAAGVPLVRQRYLVTPSLSRSTRAPALCAGVRSGRRS
jgi:hypothetical protein